MKGKSTYLINLFLPLLGVVHILPIKLSSGVLVLWCALTITHYVLNNKGIQYSKLVLTISFLFAIYLFGLRELHLFEKSSLKVIETKASLLFIPFSFYFSQNVIKRETYLLFLKIFILSTLFLNIFGNTYLLTDNSFMSDLLSSTEKSFVYREEISIPTGNHPLHISIFNLFSVMLLLRYQFYSKIYRGIIQISLVGFSLLLAAKMPILIFIICMIYYVFDVEKIHKSITRKKLISGIALLIVFISTIAFLPNIRERIVEIYSTKWQAPVEGNHNSINIRFGTNNCAIQVIKNNPIFGVGFERAQENLNKCLYNIPTEIYKERDFNTHNQYFDILVSTGIVGFIFFLMYFFYLIKKSMSMKDWIISVFFIFILVSFTTENILSRQKSLVFYTLFVSAFFSKSNFTNQEESSSDDNAHS